VLLTVRVAVAGEEPVTFGDDGETVQVRVAEVGEQLRLTVPVNPYRGVMVIAEVPDPPGAEILMLDGLNETLKSVTVIVTGAELEAA
jgi:hypothetical protein